MQRANHLAISIAILAVFSSPALTRKPAIREHYFRNWYLKHVIPNELVLNQNFNRHRDFGYVTCHYGRKSNYCNVTLLHTNSSEYRAKSCKLFDFSIPQSAHVSTLLVPDDVRERDRVAILWNLWKTGQRIKVSYVNMTSCQCNDTDWMSVEWLSLTSRLLRYSYPALVAGFENFWIQTSFLAFSFDDEKPIAKTLAPMNYSYYGVFEEAPTVGDSHPGQFFMYVNRTESSVMYKNLSNSVPKKIGVANDHFRISGAHNKYGVCWRNFRQINCTQYDVHGRQVLNGSTVKLSRRFNWWKNYNLEEPAMLLITGRCHKGKCIKFHLTKIQADGIKSRPVEIDSLSIDCPRKGEFMKLVVSEDPDKKLICFNFVIKKNKGHYRVHLQYRRLCIDQDYVNDLL